MKKGTKKVILVSAIAMMGVLGFTTKSYSPEGEQVMAEMPVQTESVTEEVTEEVVEEKVVDTKKATTKRGECPEAEKIETTTVNTDTPAEVKVVDEATKEVVMEDNKKEIEETTKAVEEAKKQGDKVEEISTEKGDIVVITKETPVDTDVEEAPKGEKKALDFSAAVEIDSEESK